MSTSGSFVIPNIELPIDLIFDILLRLPVKPVLRFKSVCKTWYALIQDPDFINKHHTRSKQNLDHTFTSVLVTERIEHSRTDDIWLRYKNKTHTPHPNFTNHHQTRSKQNLNHTLTSVLVTGHIEEPGMNRMWIRCINKTDTPKANFLFLHYPCIEGICHGLVCATLDRKEIIICNPATGRLRKIPEFSLPRIDLYHEVLGFGFHDNDYKLFRIVHPPSPGEFGFRVEVYSMNTNIWREIEVNTGEIDTRLRIHGGFSDMPVTTNGFFFWKAHCDASCVASFDMNGHVFGMIACPEEITRGYRVYWRLVDLNGELALTCNTRWFNVWVLNEKERSWTMKFRLEDISINRSLNMLGCMRNGNLVMQYVTRDLDLKLLSYDPESHDIMYLSYAGLKQRQVVYLFTESLLSV